MMGDADSRPKLLRGKQPEGHWQSPGRVNLIGEFTDYNMGLVLPFAIPRRLHLLAALLDDPEVVVSSAQTSDVVVRNLNELTPDDPFSWASYVTKSSRPKDLKACVRSRSDELTTLLRSPSATPALRPATSGEPVVSKIQ